MHSFPNYVANLITVTPQAQKALNKLVGTYGAPQVCAALQANLLAQLASAQAQGFHGDALACTFAAQCAGFAGYIWDQHVG